MGKFARMEPATLQSVGIGGGFWGERQETVRRASIPATLGHLEKEGRIDAFRLDWKPGKPNQPHIFWDSDVAKWLESAAYSLALHPDAALERKVEHVVDLVAKAQQDDGYLNVYYTVVAPRKRFTNLRDQHELYCAGHMMEAAVALWEGLGKRKLLDAMSRYGDLAWRTFGPKRWQKRGYCGHPEVELALVRLYRATGKRRYLDLARFFVTERGRKPFYFDIEARARGENPDKAWGARGIAAKYDYFQAHKPLRQQDAIEGHSVRALYLASGLADVADECGDRGLLDAARRLFRSAVRRRMYVTGGVGSSHDGERFTFDYDLPNERAYAETCAAISLVFFAHRMLQMEADGEYADVMERALYNGVLSGVSLDGKSFFYVNPLISHPGPLSGWGDQNSWTRQSFFGCACCPNNLTRMVASLGRYMYSRSRDGVYVHLYGESSFESWTGGTRVRLSQETEYPWDGTVDITVSPDRQARFSLCLRVPGWCRGARITVNGRPVPVGRVTRKGYAVLSRKWSPRDRVRMVLPMPVQREEARPEVRMDCGKVAVRRGPVVYCLEERDNGKHLADVALPRNGKLKARFERGLLGGTVAITGRGVRRNTGKWGDALYRAERSRPNPVRLKFVPYFLWNNRGPGEMMVWVREN